MKRSLFLLILAISVTCSLMAQIKFGAKAGLNVSTLTGVSEQKTNSINMAEPLSGVLVGAMAGGYIYYDFRFPVKWLGVQAEVHYSMQGGRDVHFWQNGENHPIGKLRQNYINIPLLLKFNLNKVPLSFLVGRQTGFCVGRYVDGNSILRDKSKNAYFQNMDVAIVFGAQYQWNEHLLLGIRANWLGTNSIENDESASVIGKNIDTHYVYKSWGAANWVLQLSAGWTF